MSDVIDLVLDFNEIESLPSDVFYELSSLEWISIRGNKIARLHDENFIANSKLKWISIDENFIQKLNEKVFERNLELEVFSFGNNQLKEICVDFYVFQSLKYLDLRGNKCIDELMVKRAENSSDEFFESIEEKAEKCRDSIIGIDIEDDVLEFNN